MIVKESLILEKQIFHEILKLEIDFSISTTNHSEIRQGRHETFVDDKEIIENIKAAFPKIMNQIIFDIADIGERVLIKNRDTNLNIVGVPKSGGEIIVFKVITVMREKNFRNIKGTKTIRVGNDDINKLKKGNLEKPNFIRRLFLNK
ncbi:MAG: hypothetical protein ACOC3V_05560 [bacterium]